MKYILKNQTIIIINSKINKRIILNFNDNSKEMTLNTCLSIKEVNDKKIKEECYILNINRYKKRDNKVVLKQKINNPKINIFNFNVTSYIESINNKKLIDFVEKDRMIIIFSSSNLNAIFEYIKSIDDIDNILLELMI